MPTTTNCWSGSEKTTINHYFPSRASLISSLISSRLIPASPLSAALLRNLSKASLPLLIASSFFEASITKGIFRPRTTARAKIVKAVFALIPNSPQSASNCTLRSLSIRIVIAVCPIMIVFFRKYNHLQSKYKQYDIKMTSKCHQKQDLTVISQRAQSKVSWRRRPWLVRKSGALVPLP